MAPALSNETPEHALPFRVLMEEIYRGTDPLPQDVEAKLQAWENAERDLIKARGENLQGDPVQDEAILKKYNEALKHCAEKEQPLKKILHDADLSALCFSGGGIRSASFGLGVLRELARQTWKPPASDGTLDQTGILRKINYVSTVSGGGYVGSWFTGWIKRDNLNGVIRELADFSLTSADPEPAPIRHLRDYTSYLAPRSGLLSPDMWTLVAIFLRNLLLNWAILVPTFAALLLLPILDSYALSWLNKQFDAYKFLQVAALLAAFALLWTAWNLPSTNRIQPKKSWRTNFAWVGVPLLLSAWSLSAGFLRAYTERVDFDNQLWRLGGMAVIAYAALIVVRLIASSKKQGRANAPHTFRDIAEQVLACLGAALLGAWILWLMALHVGPLLLGRSHAEDIRLFTALAVPIALGAFALTAVLLNGLSSSFDSEEDREWWSRSGAYVLMGIIAWPLVHLLVLYNHEITESAKKVFFNVPGAVSIPALTGLIGALASWVGFSPATASAHAKVDVDKLKGKAKLLAKSDMLIPALGVLFFVLLGIALAQANDWLCRWIGGSKYPCDIPVGDIGIEFGCALGLALILNMFVNVNTFSLQAMYRGRLVRSYLGASNTKRNPNPFTNFDVDDNFVLTDAPKDQKAPLHIVNIALNLVAAKKLAWQQRKAESFTASALHCGSYRVGYRPTAEYAGTSGITLGTAMGISGAAASPNMGYHSSPILALVMTFFNARLGWWLPNPGRRGHFVWKKPSPLFSLLPLLNEALGRTTDENQWVYLSDGGHFENLALYEMVLRRCKRIIVVDGSADSSFNLEDLGNAVRKIRIDLGIPIVFDPPVLFKAPPEKADRHWFLGEIRYSAVDGEEAKDGQLLYIKASLTGDEPADVTQYSKTHSDFPHESTANQFFNEAQFESYVQLGSHIVKKIVGDRPSPISLEGLFTAAVGPESKTDSKAEVTNADVPRGTMKV